jgi:hypothetical protein
MKRTAAITFAISLFVFVTIEPYGQTANRLMNDTSQQGKTKDPKEMYTHLRNLMLRGSRSKFSLAPTSKPTEPWGVVMDWGMQRGAATVVAMSDGSASVYLSSGGGYIGGKGQEPVRTAAQEAVEMARSVKLPEQPTTDYPQPEEHGVFFYFLTDAGVFMIRTSEQELNSPRHPLRKLGDAMQGVITQYRLGNPSKSPGAKP